MLAPLLVTPRAMMTILGSGPTRGTPTGIGQERCIFFLMPPPRWDSQKPVAGLPVDRQVPEGVNQPERHLLLVRIFFPQVRDNLLVLLDLPVQERKLRHDVISSSTLAGHLGFLTLSFAFPRDLQLLP